MKIAALRCAALRGRCSRHIVMRLHLCGYLSFGAGINFKF